MPNLSLHQEPFGDAEVERELPNGLKLKQTVDPFGRLIEQKLGWFFGRGEATEGSSIANTIGLIRAWSASPTSGKALFGTCTIRRNAW